MPVSLSNSKTHQTRFSKIERIAFAFCTYLGLGIFASPAIAASRSNTPEFFYQPAANGMAATLDKHQNMPDPTTSYSSGGAKISDTKFVGSGYGGAFAYAFSEAWAITASGSMDELTTTATDQFGSATTKANGLSDLTTMLTNISQVGGVNLHIGLGLGTSLGKHTDSSGSRDGNMFSGGPSIFNFIGFSSTLGAGDYYGLKLSYTTNMEKTGNTNASNSATDYKINGGNRTALEAFFEINLFGFVEADIKAAAVFFDPTVNTYAAGNTTTADAYKVTQIGIGTQFQVIAPLNIRVAYDTTMNGERNFPTYTSAPYNQTALTIRARYEF